MTNRGHNSNGSCRREQTNRQTNGQMGNTKIPGYAVNKLRYLDTKGVYGHDGWEWQLEHL